MNINGRKLKFTFNSPVILTFVIACFLAMVLDVLTGGASTYKFFSVYRSSLLDPFTYFRFFGHSLGHMDWSHLFGNMMFILILGPLLEEKYGSKNLLIVMLTTSFVIGIINFIFQPHIRLLGASGVVFAFIMLSSITSMRDGEIPITFVLVAVFYIAEQIYEGVVSQRNASYLAHFLGGLVGSVLGYMMNKKKIGKY